MENLLTTGAAFFNLHSNATDPDNNESQQKDTHENLEMDIDPRSRRRTHVRRLRQEEQPAAKTTADKAVADIKSADYSSALSELGTLAKNAKLTPEQQQAVKDVMAQVQKAITEAAGKASGEASKALGDATKSLPK